VVNCNVGKWDVPFVLIAFVSIVLVKGKQQNIYIYISDQRESSIFLPASDIQNSSLCLATSMVDHVSYVNEKMRIFQRVLLKLFTFYLPSISFAIDSFRDLS